MFKLDGVAASGICFINSFYVKWATRMQVSDGSIIYMLLFMVAAGIGSYGPSLLK